MGMLRYKIFRDLWAFKGRTLQVVLIIGLGAGSVGMIMGTRSLFIPEMQRTWQSMNPAMVNIFTGYVDEDELLVLGREEGVVEIEGSSSTIIEWRKSPDDEWQQASLNSRADYQNQKLNKLELMNGSWPEDETLALGQDAEAFFGVSPGDQVYLRVNDREYQVEMGGTVQDQLVQPAFLGGMVQFYTTRDYFEKMVGSRDFNRILFSAAEYDEEAVPELADRVQEKLERQGYDSGRMILDPNEHIFQTQMDGIFLVLTVLGFFALALGMLLIYNTINVIIAQQVDQIGVMKAIGARTWHILRLYFLTVFMYGILALMLALPMGLFGAWGIISWLASSFGSEAGDFTFSNSSLLLMTFLCLLAPILASLIPVISGARTTVREAISTYGLSTSTGLIERLLSKARFISRLLLITISNTFRHKRRVVLLEIGLVLSGVMFMTVIAMRTSVEYTVRDVLFSILNADVTMIFESPQRIDYIEELTLSHPDVKAVEMWGLASPTIRPAGQPESEDDETLNILLGVPLPTQLFGYQMLAGRWLDEQDSFAIVLDEVLADEVGVGVGDWVTLKFEEKQESDWQVVGLSFIPLIPNTAMAPRDVLLHDMGYIGRSQVVWIQIKETSYQGQIEVAKNIRDFYETNHIDVNPQRGLFGMGDSTAETATTITSQLNFLYILLGVMSVVIAAVGSR